MLLSDAETTDDSTEDVITCIVLSPDFMEVMERQPMRFSQLQIGELIQDRLEMEKYPLGVSEMSRLSDLAMNTWRVPRGISRSW